MSLDLCHYLNCMCVCVCVCARISTESDAVLSSHGYPLPHGWFLQHGEGQLWEVQTLRNQTLPSARHCTRQGWFSFCSFLSVFLFLPLSLQSIIIHLIPRSSRCESAWFSLAPLPGWSSPWTRTPPNKIWRSAWRRFLTGVFLLSSHPQTNNVLRCDLEWVVIITSLDFVLLKQHNFDHECIWRYTSTYSM